MAYALVMTPEVRAWLHDLRQRDRASAIQIAQAIGMLPEAGPKLAVRSLTASKRTSDEQQRVPPLHPG